VSAEGNSDAMRAAAREALRELLPEMLRDALAPAAAQNGNGNGHNGLHGPAVEVAVVPQVPAPPVAAVLRPSTWTAAPAPGEIVGDSPGAVNGDAPAETSDQEPGGPPPATAGAEPVKIDSDEDLNDFVRALAARMDNPRERRAIRSGRVRFALRRSTVPARTNASAPALRIERGAVTERVVRQAAAEGARLVLARGAVLTPLGRDQARALGVEIERERKC
jgi:hypothetical protein